MGLLRSPFEPPTRAKAHDAAPSLRSDSPRDRARPRERGPSSPCGRPRPPRRGVSLSELLRQAMARTQTWTAPAREVESARTRQIARIGSNLNQIARWAHTHVNEDLAVVEVLAHLVAIERDLAALRLRGAGDAG